MESRDSLDPSTLSGIPAAFDPYNTNSFDDVVFTTDTLALDGADSPLFPADWDQETPTYDGGLYSTPLNWEAPIETKIEPIPPTPYTTMNTLTPAQQEKLRNIAMPQHLQYRGQHSPNSTASNKSRSISSPDNHEERSRKRKSSAEADDDDDDDSNPPVKKTAHNMIEKRYRTNLNDKIAALRDSVPSLRIMNKTRNGDEQVLAKATEYIHHLEKRNKRLLEENSEQKARLAAFETLFRSGSMGYTAPPMANPFQFNEYNTPGPSPGGLEPQGMIQVPDDMRRLHGHMSQQQPFSVPQEQYQPTRPVVQGGWQNNPYFGKLMVGSLAGLMFFEGMREAEQEEDTPGARGLFALPVHLLRSLSNTIHSHMEIRVAGYHVSAANTMAYLKIILVIGALLYAFLPSLFVSKPKPSNGKTQTASLAAAPSLASPIQVRRQAWLTAIQTVWVPRHNFFLEAAALCLKMVKLSLRNIIGPDGYAYLTGVTQQEEAARIKAWTIALDAQLAGGDVEVSKSRLTLTLLASGTLPDTPARLMLKALHIRVLLWEIGNCGFSGYYLFQAVAAKLARWKWNEAKQLQVLASYTKAKQEDELPPYLVTLLEQGCDDVLADSIGQRAYNLAWNLPTTHDTDSRGGSGMDGVVDDHAIRSPLDAVAAWYSSLVLQQALARSLTPEGEKDSKKDLAADITLAIRTAPIGSAAQARALVAFSVLIQKERGRNIATAIKALTPLENQDKKPSNLVNTSTSTVGFPDIKMSLSCAMAMAHMVRYPVPLNPKPAHEIIATIRPTNMTLLGFTSAFRLMETIEGHTLVAASCTNALEGLAGALRIWVGGKDGEQNCLDKEVKHAIVERCLSIQKRIVGMEDAGYESSEYP
ncbi:uncharacterized protein LY89DRAFT_579020 [Mollisia scopiformis]|uniref:BHLH domain-containing protein n=1 Tax=Mollisia scopiformis TaxID=149040 RepID=A0A194XJK6_MOLSC|nr:uncharacterized protein LY89DRAFT_579020 [Mollisia scopiformis]KUJ20425.1 hypothetical protein LY89DRAFT_579020 [Mollisia scopiformis]